MPVILGVGVAILVIVLLAVRLAYGPTFAQEDGPKVLVIGDSITDLGQQELKDELDAEYSLSLDGKTSFRTDEQLPSAERWSTRDFTQVVINLGTNDVIQGTSPSDAAANLEAMAQLFPTATCIHVVTVNELIPAEANPVADELARELNDQIRTLPSRNPRVRVIDWAAIVNEEKALGVDLTIDGVHPSDEGYVLLAQAYSEALDSCPVPE